ncbi:BapA/Bap/LapF family prefix-like domain-containing protein [Acinetobacter wanghuae]|uniref:BapA/Bap/LapF family prefix-like domain-containing protein n=1 Tax=Acinetobacter wanghuae TaxID=2662362 RepID=UPI003AF7FCB4
MQKQVISKSTWVSKLVDDNIIQLTENSVVMIDVTEDQIEKIEIVGNQLKITLKSGEILIIDNFSTPESTLVLRDSQEELYRSLS